MMRNITTILVSLIMLFSLSCFAVPDNNTYGTDARMFHIERSLNKNIVCYDFQLDDNGALNIKDPIYVYWINREKSPGNHGGLSIFQQPAFGYKVASTSSNEVTVKLNAVKSRPITIKLDGTGKYICIAEINKQRSVLQKIYVKTRESNSLKVEYVDISGIDFQTGEFVTERITP